MVLDDWIKLGVTEDDEETVTHRTVSFAPGVSEKESTNKKKLFRHRKQRLLKEITAQIVRMSIMPFFANFLKF